MHSLLVASQIVQPGPRQLSNPLGVTSHRYPGPPLKGPTELAEMTGSFETELAGVEEEEEESGSSVHGSENCLREY